VSTLSIGILAFVGVALLTSVVLLERFRERRNIETLRDRFDLDREHAERLYALARRDGFGSAYREVIGDADQTARRPVRPGTAVAQRSSGEPRSRG
jgi:hypothetical protein